MRRVLEFVMAGRSQAVGSLLLLTLLGAVVPPVWLLGGGVVALVTLRLGPGQGLWLIGWSSILLSVLSLALFGAGSGLAGAFAGGIGFGLVQWLPILAFAWLLRRTASWSLLMQALALTGMLGVLLANLLEPDLAQFWQSLLHATLSDSLQRMGMSSAEASAAIVKVARYFTGVLAATAIFGIIVALILGRYWQAVLYNPGGFGEEFRAWRLGPAFAGLVVALAAATAVTRQPVLLQLVLVGLVPFLFQGLGIVHALVKWYEMSAGWLVGVYVLLVFMTLQMAALLSLTGLVDSFVDIRGRLAKR